MEKTTQMTAAKYPDFGDFNLPATELEVLAFWKTHQVFERSVAQREGAPPFTFYEGPPSANGEPGIHHMMARAIKDLFCRYKTMRGFQVKRKAGWDTHGLPIELQVEKSLGITKEDIGKKITVDEYNQACRRDVLKFKDRWDLLTERMGYWVDLSDPYITFENNYIESVWHLLKRMYDKNFLYKGFTIQPFSPAAGTGLSSAELNQPGTYKDVTDTTIVAQFKVIREAKSEFLFSEKDEEVFILAWTTTPWTLPSNTALAVGPNISYLRVRTHNPYTEKPVTVILAEPLFGKHFKVEGEISGGKGTASFGKKEIEFHITAKYTGRELTGVRYEQLLPYVQPEGEAFRVIAGDFVTTEDGTGIVHIAPTFGADDLRVATQNGIKGIWVTDDDGNPSPLVDRKGKFVKEMGEFAGRFVKDYKDQKDYESPDIDIAIKLKQENRAFNVQKYVHNYPHCWRTDKPVLYYPLDSWFVRTTAVKERLVELNKTINWKPASTGTGRFGNWLENLVDWNLSRSRFWGIPLPIWRTEDNKEELCFGSIQELKDRADKSVTMLSAAQLSEEEKGLITATQAIVHDTAFDLHKPTADRIFFLSDTGKFMRRESDLIDVWFDSGSMPYAQWHYPFENQDMFKKSFPADFIAEGVDQTRGWFFTLHAIAVILEDSVAYKNVMSNGLVLDENGEKMSKRKGNVVNPFLAIDMYGSDPVRWYMMSNTPPWEDLKFSWTKYKPDGTKAEAGYNGPIKEEKSDGIQLTVRSFFGTLFNTYKLFSLYANIDGFIYSMPRVPAKQRAEIDRWVLSRLNNLIVTVGAALDNYDPTRAARAIENFVDEHLSNWYVRLCRRRFWKGEINEDKVAAYQTLYECLIAVSKLMAPISPFFADKIYTSLNGVTRLEPHASVHHALWPEVQQDEIEEDREEAMELAQRISSLVHSIRKDPRVNVKVRQPLSKLLVPVSGDTQVDRIDTVKDLILSEVNVKELRYLRDGDPENPITKKIKPNFRSLGPKLGKDMKDAVAAVGKFTAADIARIEMEGKVQITAAGGPFELLLEDVEITNDDVPGWKVASGDGVTVALDVTVNEALMREGIAREFVNRIQNLRKDKDFQVTDHIRITVTRKPEWTAAIQEFLSYICAETLADELKETDDLPEGDEIEVNDIPGKVLIEK